MVVTCTVRGDLDNRAARMSTGRRCTRGAMGSSHTVTVVGAMGRGRVAGGGVSEGTAVLLGVGAIIATDSAVLGEVQVETAIVPPAGQGDGCEGNDGDEEEIEDTEINKHGRHANDVSTVADAEGDNVIEPEEVGPAGQKQIIPSDAGAGGARPAVSEGTDGQDKPGEGAKSEEAPLVVAGRERRDEIGDDPDPGQDDIVHDAGPGCGREQTQGDDDDWEGDHPENVLGPEDLSGEPVAPLGLLDQTPGQVGSLGVVDDGTSQKGNGEEVMEDALAMAGPDGEDEEGQEGDDEDRGYCPEPVRPVGREVLVSCWRVGFQRPAAVSCKKDGIHLGIVVWLGGLAVALRVCRA